MFTDKYMHRILSIQERDPNIITGALRIKNNL